MNERAGAAAIFGFLSGSSLMGMLFAIVYTLETGITDVLGFAITIAVGSFAFTLFGAFAVILSLGE